MRYVSKLHKYCCLHFFKLLELEILLKIHLTPALNEPVLKAVKYDPQCITYVAVQRYPIPCIGLLRRKRRTKNNCVLVLFEDGYRGYQGRGASPGVEVGGQAALRASSEFNRGKSTKLSIIFLIL